MFVVGKMTNTETDADITFIEHKFSNWKDSSKEKGAISRVAATKNL